MWLHVRHPSAVWGSSSETKPKGKPDLKLDLWSPLHPTGKTIFSLVLPQHLCSWRSGRPHMKQTKLVKLTITPFLVVVDLSAEESTNRISCTCFWKFPRMKIHVHTVHMVLFANSLRRWLSKSIHLWATSEVSHVGPPDFLSSFLSAT